MKTKVNSLNIYVSTKVKPRRVITIIPACSTSTMIVERR